jgi:hypothetical protein
LPHKFPSLLHPLKIKEFVMTLPLRIALALPATLLVLLPRPASAQTAPVFENRPAAPSASTAAALIENSFDTALEAAGTPASSLATAASSVEIGEEAGASAARALKWKYLLGSVEPRLSWKMAAPLDLSGARSVALKVKSDTPGAVEIWFETGAGGEGADATVLRYSATVWSAGVGWQAVDVDRARFSLREVKGGALGATLSGAALWESSWARIEKWGVADASNFWRAFTGQPRLAGPRTLWIDDLRVSAAPSSNPAKLAPAAPAPPQPNASQNDENEDEEADGGDENGAPNGFNGGFVPQRFERAASPLQIEIADGFDGPGFDGAVDAEEEQEEAPQADDEPMQAVVQDAWGALESWIAINGTTTPLPGERAGLKWSVVRLANREALLVSPVNPDLLSAFPPDRLRSPIRDPKVAFRIEIDRLVRLAITVSTQKNSALQVALHEAGGGVWSVRVPLEARRRRHTLSVPLASLTTQGGNRDADGKINLDRVIAISLREAGADKGLAGPNEVTLHGVTWIY